MGKKLMVTLFKVTMPPPGEEFEFKGYAENGYPIVNKRSMSIPPGTFLELEEPMLGELLSLGAVRKATRAEREAHKGQGSHA